MAIKLSKKIKQSLDDLIQELKTNWFSNKRLDYNRLLNKFNIQYYESPKTMIPFVRHDKGCYYIINFPFWFSRAREFAKVHELAHVILRHPESNLKTDQKEVEANYLTEQLTASRRYVGYIGAVEIMLRTCCLFFAEPDQDKLFHHVVNSRMKSLIYKNH